MSPSTGFSKTYYLAKLSDIMYELLIHPGDAKQRLFASEISIKYILSFPVPEQIKPFKKIVVERLLKEEIGDPNESFEICEFKFIFSGMRLTAVVKIIKELNDLFIAMREYSGEEKI